MLRVWMMMDITSWDIAGTWILQMKAKAGFMVQEKGIDFLFKYFIK